ncbi:ABC transporter substrate-binding protein, partial [Rhizobium ruizarguesonis]
MRAGFEAATALTALVVFGKGGAAAESVMTMHIEEQSSWVQKFNPFDLAGRRQSTMDF